METEDQHTPETALRERSRLRSSLDAGKASLGATGRGTSSAGCPPYPVPAPATANLAPTATSSLSRSFFTENLGGGGVLPKTPGIEVKIFRSSTSLPPDTSLAFFFFNSILAL